MKEGKIIVVSAPSGCGKSTIIHAIISEGKIDLQFSVSATNRAPREGEEDGRHYYFLSTERFRQLIAEDRFVEWEEVYPGRFYGTLCSEVDRIVGEGHNVILDIDVKGALNVKKKYGARALTIFIEPPSVDELRHRLEGRGTDAPDVIDVRVAKAEYELGFAGEFDTVIVNDDLGQAIGETKTVITDFINDAR